ncbi:hypothetical protein XM76_c11573 [Vibrio vulnificus]|nr:hypothetical protein XM76_c11573 [Vibrio vulnificus]
MFKYTILSLFSYLVLISFSIYLGSALSIPVLQGNNIIALLLPLIVLNYKLNIEKGFSGGKVFIAFFVSIIYCFVSSVVSYIQQAKLLDTVEVSLVTLFPFALLCILFATKRI